MTVSLGNGVDIGNIVTSETNALTGGIEILGVKLAYIIAQSAVPASVTGTTAETTLASIAVPAMGPNDSLRVTEQWSFTGSTNLKTMMTKINNATFAMTSTNTAANLIAKQEVTVMNRNATNSQLGSMFGFGYSSSTSGSFMNPSVETSGNNTVLIRGKLALETETLTLEGYIVELIRG